MIPAGPASGPRTGDALPAPPPYGRTTLAELLPSVLAALGVPGESNALGLPAVRRACVLLIDGLGHADLAAAAADAPYLASLLAAGRPLSTGFPATTPTSLGCLGTGLPPGRHGLTGYRTAVPGRSEPLDALRWDDGVDPEAWQPERTVFERAAAAGVAVTHVAPSRFRGSGLTVAALRGARYAGADSAGERIADAAAALRADGPALAYVYVSDLDATGHRRGKASAAWRHQLRQLDLFAEQLAAALPAGAALWITGDHGMVDVDEADKIDADAAGSPLREGVALLAGEPRARYAHAAAGAAADVLATWREALGDRFHVLSRAEVVQAGWIGAGVRAEVLGRIGDVVAVARDGAAVVARTAEPGVSGLVGMHGALTDAERWVPLLGPGVTTRAWAGSGEPPRARPTM